ncbi:hypothetical protein L9F63_019322, partial [Diploptera punctata]
CYQNVYPYALILSLTVELRACKTLTPHEESVTPSNKQGHLISNEFFRGTDLLKRSPSLVQDSYQEQSLKTLVRIREMVGEARFDRFLAGFHPQCDSGIDLHATSQTNEPTVQGYWSESSSPKGASSSTISPEDIQFRDQNQNLVYVGDDKSSSSENVDSSPSPKEEFVEEMQERDSAIQIIDDEQSNEVYEQQGNGIYRQEDEVDDVAIRGVIREEAYYEERENDNNEELDGAITVLEGDPLEEEVLNSVLTDDEDYNDDEDVAVADQPIRRTPRR